MTAEHKEKIGAANREALKGRKLSLEHIRNRTDAQTIHGETRKGYRSRLFRTWDAMVQRCTNPNIRQAKDYIGRGIRVCEEWLLPRQGFANFRAYVLATLGPKPDGMSLDRIDNDGPYAPGNIRWATRQQQQANRRISQKP